MMDIDKLIELSLQEDIGNGDITTSYLDLGNKRAVAFFSAKEQGVLAGWELVPKLFNKLNPLVSTIAYKKDGDFLKPGEEIAKVTGPAKDILAGERVALNFLQRLSGIATCTAKMVELIAPYGVRLLDTRKTTPLLRQLEKYAVKVGGGHNHRYGLYDMVLIKDNHIEAVGSIKEAVRRVRSNNLNYKIEVEVKNIKELREALACSADRVLLDNMSVFSIKKAVAEVKKYEQDNIPGKVETEISGGVKLRNIEKYARTGVDFISTGAITHSAKALDITLLFREI